MEVRHTVQRFPGAAFLLILGLAAALVTMLALSFGVWRAGPAASQPTTQPAAQSAAQPALRLQQPPDAQDRNRQFALPPGPACSWQQGGACSASP